MTLVQKQSKERFSSTVIEDVQWPPEIAMDLIREKSMVGIAFDEMTVTLYGAQTFSKDLESAHVIKCACALLHLGFDDTTASAMLCHKQIRYTLKPHYQAVMELAQKTSYDIARLVERSCFIPNLESNREYFLKLEEFATSDCRILAIIGVDWCQALQVVRLGKSYSYSSDLKLIAEVLPQIKLNWDRWMENVPSHEKDRINTIWNTLFELAEELEYI